MSANSFPMLAAIEQADLPALRIVFTVAAICFVYGGVFIFRKRRQFFDRDPTVANNAPAARPVRLEAILFVWTALMLALLGILRQVWSI
jgi:hypothetical protein